MGPEGLDVAFLTVSNLAATFKANENRYLSSGYQEAEVRKDFIDKFFIALGWDVNHDVQTNPYAQEVKVERSVAASGQRRADYAFYLKPNYRDVRFFVEAKKPSVDIGSTDNYFQLIRYGWNGETPLAVLTDFERLHILDCRYKPDVDAAPNRAVAKYHYSDYTDRDKFAEIYWLFSREAVADGSLEKRAKDLPKPRGKAVQRGLFPGGFQSIDESFLTELDEYRAALARTFKAMNPNLDSDTLTEIAQRTLDRLVFVRFLEDKGIEAQRLVDTFGEKGKAWEDFVAASRRLDGIYNGIVFKHHDILDSNRFRVDDTVFADICESLVHVNSPYDFNVIPIHILGSIYERFLGKVIVATDKRVRVEEKPEVRKAGGVYYTPEYIVRYIVENTIGRLIAGKTPDQIAKMRFCDIACGSGSFLLGIYDLLLSYHGIYYNRHPAKARKGDCIRRDGKLYLSLLKKREILLNNIYGVDIDAQAVEVAQLSLYLKLLQEETTASTHEHQLEFHETLLPSLTKNIVCGNSLVGTDILDGQLFTTDEERKLNPMNFEDAFPQVMKAGGFDAIVGNPPYVRPHNLTDTYKQYFWEHYKTFTHKSDLYCCFIEKATRLLRQDGFFSYIVSHGWLRLNSFQELRKMFLRDYRILQIIELPENVFPEAQVTTCVFVAQRDASQKRMATKIDVLEGNHADTGWTFPLKRRIPQNAFRSTFQNVFDLSISPETEQIKEKMRLGPSIGSIFRVCFGLKTGDDRKFLHHTKGFHRDDKPLLRGEDVKRYAYEYKGEYVWYVREKMRAHRPTSRPGERERFEQPKVLVKDTTADFAGTYENRDFYVKDVLIVIPQEGKQAPFDLRYVAGIVNSRALRFYYRSTFKTIHVQCEELSALPLPPLDLKQNADKVRHDEMVRKVQTMLEARKQLAKAKTDKDKAYYESKVSALDRQIDELVYELYGLTPEEIAVVEQSQV
jgi:adenine-specific DNA-methyltransferase